MQRVGDVFAMRGFDETALVRRPDLPADARARRGPSGATSCEALLEQLFEVDPLACPTCHGAMRSVACITQAPVIEQTLTHLRTRAGYTAHVGAPSPPSTRAPSRGTSHARPPTPRSPRDDGPPTPRDHAGTFGVRGRPRGASDGSPPASATPRCPPCQWRSRRTSELEGTPPPVTRR